MSAVLQGPETEVKVTKNYINADHTIKSWLLTVDHKRIALMYLLGVTFFFFLGGLAAGVIRAELT